MRFAIIENGKIMGFRDIPAADAVILSHYRQTEALVEVSEEIQPDSHYYRDGAFKLIPDSPSPYHEWDPLAEEWEFDEVAAGHDIRQKRNELLEQSDWAVLTDVPLSKTQKTAVKAYRQALRNITEQSDPGNIEWPEKPEVIK